MKVYRVRAPGSLDGLVMGDEDLPPPGPHQVLVRVRATSLNNRDQNVLMGRSPRGAALPDVVPLSDGAGEVIAIGTDVSRVKVGDRVAGNLLQAWISGESTPEVARSGLGGQQHGMLAEQVLLPEEGLVHLPAHLSFEEGATLPCAALTAWNALAEYARVKPGETVLVQGTGGVSIFALQFARMMGARVIATSSSDAKLERLRTMGAHTCINYRTTPEWDVPARAATGGRGVDVVVEIGGPGTFMCSLRALRPGGRMALIGALAAGADINPTTMMRAHVNLQGIFCGSRTMFEEMNRAIAVNGMRPVIDRVFEFADAVSAYRHQQGRTHFGKVVIRHG
jgi:NADPH:quinone reductase-like Zn-dependent oxidoreductase